MTKELFSFALLTFAGLTVSNYLYEAFKKSPQWDEVLGQAWDQAWTIAVFALVLAVWDRGLSGDEDALGDR